jgi:hypothetical protein
MLVKQMHLMRIKEAEAKRSLARSRKKTALTPLAKEIELRREEMIRGILQNTPNIINKQLEVAALTVSETGDNNDTIMKATNSLLDRVFGKPKETVDLQGNVQFSLKALAQERLKVENKDVTSLEENYG